MDQISGFIEARGLPKYRADQLLNWIYERYAASLDEVTEYSKDLRGRLGEIAYIGSLEVLDRLRSSDGTEKFLFGLEDGQSIESVLIPSKDRLTLCISSQVGCAMGCSFCLTGDSGLIRNLRAWEIVEQVLSVNRLIRPKKVTNIVLMGMGEPLANYRRGRRGPRSVLRFHFGHIETQDNAFDIGPGAKDTRSVKSGP